MIWKEFKFHEKGKANLQEKKESHVSETQGRLPSKQTGKALSVSTAENFSGCESRSSDLRGGGEGALSPLAAMLAFSERPLEASLGYRERLYILPPPPPIPNSHPPSIPAKNS